MSEHDDTFKQLSAESPLGIVCQHLRLEGEHHRHQNMLDLADICTRRAHDPDPDVRNMIRAFLFLYANTRNIDVDAMMAQVRVH